VKLRREVPQHELIPRAHGFAWWLPERAVAVFYPVPLNLILGFARNAFHWLRFAIKPSVIDRAYYRGEAAGRRAGWEQGKESAIRESEILKALERGLVAEETLLRVMGLKKEDLAPPSGP
jgi:hypothetical protein